MLEKDDIIEGEHYIYCGMNGMGMLTLSNHRASINY